MSIIDKCYEFQDAHKVKALGFILIFGQSHPKDTE